MKEKMRIDKFISIVYNLSRRDAREFIKKNNLHIGDHRVIKNDNLIDLENEKVYLDGEIIPFSPLVYLMLNKPAGYISATTDELHPTIISLIKGYDGYELFMVGRLDIDTEGLILITNDGKFAHHLTSPKSNCPKKYYIEASAPFTADDVLKMKEGFIIYDGNGNPYHTMPAKLEIIGDCKGYLTINEGKYHQVKKMCKACGKEVLYLRREAIGPLHLDQNLQLGEYRPLTDEEIKMLKK